MASTVVDFTEDDSGSDHEHWPEDFNPTPAVATSGHDTHNGVHMSSYQPAVPVAMEASSPPPSPDKSVKAAPLTHAPLQYVYAPAVPKMTGHTVAAAPAPKAADPNVYTYHPTFSAPAPTPETNKWQGRTTSEVEEDNVKIAAAEKVWEKRKVVPTGLADDQMCWVVAGESSYTLR